MCIEGVSSEAAMGRRVGSKDDLHLVHVRNWRKCVKRGEARRGFWGERDGSMCEMRKMVCGASRRSSGDPMEHERCGADEGAIETKRRKEKESSEAG